MSTRGVAQHWCPECQTYLLESREIYLGDNYMTVYDDLCLVCKDKVRTGELVPNG